MPLFVFLFNPLLAFLGAMKRLDAKFNGLVFVMFYALFGYAISFTLTSADSYRIGARFCQQRSILEELWTQYLEGNLTDVYMLFVFGLLRPLTHNPKVLFLVFGTVLGLFACLSMRQLYKVWPNHRNKYFYVLVVIFFLFNSFLGVNGVRFNTGSMFFVFLVIQYLYFHKRYALFAVLLTPLFHFGFLIGVFVFYVYLLFRRWKLNIRFYFKMYVLTMCLSLITPQSLIGDNIGDTTEMTDSKALNSKAGNYVKNSKNNKNMEAKKNADQSLYRQANNAYTKFFGLVNSVGTFILFVVLYKKRKILELTDSQQQFWQFIFYFYCIAVFVSLSIGSGARFLYIAQSFLYFWYTAITPRNFSSYWKKQTKWLMLINFYTISFIIFNSIRLVTPLFWIAPPLITIIEGIGFGPIDFVN